MRNSIIYLITYILKLKIFKFQHKIAELLPTYGVKSGVRQIFKLAVVQQFYFTILTVILILNKIFDNDKLCEQNKRCNEWSDMYFPQNS